MTTWSKQNKNTTSWSNSTKHQTTFINEDRTVNPLTWDNADIAWEDQDKTWDEVAATTWANKLKS